MTNRYQAQVTIAGKVLPSSGNGSDMVVLDGLRIVWGRDDIYSEPEPSTLAVQVIDPFGNWSSDNTLIGQPVIVKRLNPDVIMFRGRITGVKAALTCVADLLTGRPRQVWRTQITASDILADLAQAVQPGPGGDPASDTDDTYTDRWPSSFAGNYTISPQFPGNRYDDIMTQGASQFVAGIEHAEPGQPQYPQWMIAAQVRLHQFGEKLSFLELIRLAYRSRALAHTNYDASTNWVRLGLPALTSGFALTLDAGTIQLSPLAGRTVPADQVEVPDGVTLESTVASGIDRVNVTCWATGFDGKTFTAVERVQFALTSQYVPSARGQRVLDWTTDNDNQTQADYLASQIAALVDGINGKFHLSGLRYDFRRSVSGDPAVDELLLDTKDNPTPLFFAGAYVNQFLNVGPQYQLIGGTLTWVVPPAGNELPAGWVLEDIKLAPTAGVVAGVTLAELVTNDGPTIADFDPSITLADLGAVTLGLS